MSAAVLDDVRPTVADVFLSKASRCRPIDGPMKHLSEPWWRHETPSFQVSSSSSG